MELSNQLIAVINALCEKMGLVIDWSQENVVPYLQDLIQRIISYRKAELIFCIIADIVVIFICVIVLKKSIGKIRQIKPRSFFDDCAVPYAFCTVICCFVALFFTFNVYFSITNIMEISFIPEKYIIEMLQGLTVK